MTKVRGRGEANSKFIELHGSFELWESYEVMEIIEFLESI